MYATFGDQTLKWLLGSYSNPLHGSKSWIEKLCAVFCVASGLHRCDVATEAQSLWSLPGSSDAADGNAGTAASYASGQNDFLEQVIYIVCSSFCLRKARVQRLEMLPHLPSISSSWSSAAE